MSVFGRYGKLSERVDVTQHTLGCLVDIITKEIDNEIEQETARLKDSGFIERDEIYWKNLERKDRKWCSRFHIYEYTVYFNNEEKLRDLRNEKYSLLRSFNAGLGTAYTICNENDIAQYFWDVGRTYTHGKNIPENVLSQFSDVLLRKWGKERAEFFALKAQIIKKEDAPILNTVDELILEPTYQSRDMSHSQCRTWINGRYIFWNTTFPKSHFSKEPAYEWFEVYIGEYSRMVDNADVHEDGEDEGCYWAHFQTLESVFEFAKNDTIAPKLDFVPYYFREVPDWEPKTK